MSLPTLPPDPMDPLLRILDANFNRAREALRVLEDISRFGRSDAALSSGLKSLRHTLSDISGELDPVLLVANRDTPGDAGTTIRASGEYVRNSMGDIAGAASGRLGEALRSIEECLKGLGRADLASSVEQARYRAYDLCGHLRLSLGTGRARQWRVCVLISESLCVRPWRDVALAAIDGGADCIQLREKTLDDGELLRRASALVAMARPRACSVIVNDRPDIALLANADGVHVGQGDLPVEQVRRIAGARLLVGVSTHNLTQATEAVRAGADYIGLGPMFPTTTKHTPVLAGPGLLRACAQHADLAGVPHLAIGGITPDNAVELAAAGCVGIAVSSVVCGASDPAAIVSSLVRSMSEGARGAQ